MKRSLLCTIILSVIFKITVASIAGVTYMDHFDFEQRYRDVNECNPFYWHPLHLPEKCMQMFEKLIRSGLKPLKPYRIVKEESTSAAELPEFTNYQYNYFYNPVYNTGSYNSKIEYLQPFEIQNLSPFEIMFELLRRDIRDIPSAPSLGVSPYLGVIAMYKQPVSYKSMAMIKKLSRAYGNSDYYNTVQSEIDNGKHGKKENKIKINKKVVNGTIVVDKVIKSNDAITLLKIKRIK